MHGKEEKRGNISTAPSDPFLSSYSKKERKEPGVIFVAGPTPNCSLLKEERNGKWEEEKRMPKRENRKRNIHTCLKCQK